MAAGEDRVSRSPTGDIFAGIPLLSDKRPDPNDIILVPPPDHWLAGQAPSENEMWEAFVRARFKQPVFLVEKIEEKAGPCVDVPLIGPLRRVSCQFKCTLYFNERIGDEVKRDVAVVYVEKGRLDRCDQAEHGHPTGRKFRN